MSSITEKVRDTINEICMYVPSYKLDKLVIICNRIDAKYEELERKLENSIQLPVDRDGVPIHIGDKMAFNFTGNKYDVRYVVGIGGEGEFYAYGECGDIVAHASHRCKHYKPDSWDLIIHDAVCGGDEDELVARCKALAGEAK